MIRYTTPTETFTLTVEYTAELQNECSLTVKEGAWTLSGDMYQKNGSWQQVSNIQLGTLITKE